MASLLREFLSYRSVGTDAWWDEWEVLRGDNAILKINDCLENCECSVVFLSNGSATGVWQLDEVRILKIFAVTEQRPLILAQALGDAVGSLVFAGAGRSAMDCSSVGNSKQRFAG